MMPTLRCNAAIALLVALAKGFQALAAPVVGSRIHGTIALGIVNAALIAALVGAIGITIALRGCGGRRALVSGGAAVTLLIALLIGVQSVAMPVVRIHVHLTVLASIVDAALIAGVVRALIFVHLLRVHQHGRQAKRSHAETNHECYIPELLLHYCFSPAPQHCGDLNAAACIGSNVWRRSGWLEGEFRESVASLGKQSSTGESCRNAAFPGEQITNVPWDQGLSGQPSTADCTIFGSKLSYSGVQFAEIA